MRNAPLTTDERRRCYAALGTFVRSNWQMLLKHGVKSSLALAALTAHHGAGDGEDALEDRPVAVGPDEAALHHLDALADAAG